MGSEYKDKTPKGLGGIVALGIGLMMVAGLLYLLVYVNIQAQDNPMVMAVTGFVFLLIVGSSVFRAF